MSSYASIRTLDSDEIERQFFADRSSVHCQQVDPEEYIIPADPEIPVGQPPPVSNSRPNRKPDNKDNEIARQVMLGIRE